MKAHKTIHEEAREVEEFFDDVEQEVIPALARVRALLIRIKRYGIGDDGGGEVAPRQIEDAAEALDEVIEALTFGEADDD